MRNRLWRHSMERKYVNEEQYQHVIKVLKVLRILFLVLGVALLVGGVGLSMIIHRREITGFMVQQSEPIVREGYQAYKDTIQEAVKDTCEAINSTKGERVEDPDKDHKFCKYCGNVLENDAVFCEFCGKKLN